MSVGITIRRARPAEGEILTRIAHAAKRHWGYSEEWIRLWRKDLSVDQTFIRGNRVFVATVVDEPVAFYALTGSGREHELEHFWVDPEHMNKGIGRRLFAHAVKTARSSGADSIKIVSDPHAEGFYLQMGADRVGEHASQPPGRMLPVLSVNT